MREILFRGKSILGKWVEGLPYEVDGVIDCIRVKEQIQDIISYTTYKVIPETVGQYTGLTDKNGTKIFEGDIIRQINNYDNLEMIGIVVFSKSAQFVIHHTYTKNENIYKAGKKKHFAINPKCEVIGNIHDNSELMKEGAE